jgi:hypothetical protein
MPNATGYVYGSALKSIVNKEIDYDTDTIKVMLTTSTYSPNRSTHRYKSDVTNEVAGTGYTAGGATLANKAVTVTAANSWSIQAAVSTAYTVGSVVRPTTGNGFLYQCVVAGTSAGSAPTWPTVVGTTVADNTVTWLNIGSVICTLTCDPQTWGSSTITARYAVFYEDTGTGSTSALICYWDFVSDQSSSNGNFTLTPGASGLVTEGVA